MNGSTHVNYQSPCLKIKITGLLGSSLLIMNTLCIYLIFWTGSLTISLNYNYDKIKIINNKKT